jgi:hypothetical protein
VVELKSYGAGDFCSKCFNYFDDQSGFSSSTQESAQTDQGSEVSLREAFESMGLSDEGAEIAAKGRRTAWKLGSTTNDPVAIYESLKESFQDMGLSESAAEQAAKGRR